MYQPRVFICKAQRFASVRAAGQDPLVSLSLPALQLSPGLLLRLLFVVTLGESSPWAGLALVLHFLQPFC